MRWANNRRYVQFTLNFKWFWERHEKSFPFYPVRVRIWAGLSDMQEDCELPDNVVGYCEDIHRINYANGKEIDHGREIVVHLANGEVGSCTVAHELDHATFRLIDQYIEAGRSFQCEDGDQEEWHARILGWLVGGFWVECYKRFDPVEPKRCDQRVQTIARRK